MRWKLAAGLILLLAAAVPPAVPGASVPVEPNVGAVYDFYFRGLRIAKMKITAEFGADSYQASGHFETVGLVELFADSDMDAEAVGKLGANGFAPLHFRSQEVGSKKERRIDITFAGDRPSAIDVAPAFKNKPWSIDPLEQRGVTDPLSAALTIVVPGPADAVCGRRIEAPDGRRRFALDIAAPRSDGDRIRCDATFIRLGGYTPEQMEDDRRRPFTLHLAKRPIGDFQVVEVTVPTGLGDVVLVLRD